MSGCLWCDPGKHAFSALDEDMEVMTRQKKVTNRATGRKEIEEVEFHICGTHALGFDANVTNPETKAINGTVQSEENDTSV